MYHVNEIEHLVHQDDGDQVMHEASHDGEDTVIEANLEDLLRDKWK
jgi:hypothetical protein